ncbi:cell division protein FtsA [Erythrobacter sp. SDW2]|uniref:cell division protein FtsA n=1 Tax=Erythrobacter sp. SDW2 TaxID=2907154 RepID=UPI001F314E24|nr:cell division protein FtsA [Erythrobacter sp. SDW2]UIP06478.1 cell division protein FtsA [Erythrobacter sp. SDW2]
MGLPRISRIFGAVNLGSVSISAMIMGLSETGELVVLGSGLRQSQGIRRGYITDMAAATYAIRQVMERAEENAGARVQSLWVGCAGAGLTSRIARVEVPIGGRQIEEEDIEHLLLAARDNIEPDGRMVLHAQPAHYTLDGAHGVANPKGLHAEQLGVDVHVMLADGAPVRNLKDAVERAHFSVESVVATPIAAGMACLSPEERELGTALIELGGEVTNVSVFKGGMLAGLISIPLGGNDITDAIASAFGVRRFQAERLKCLSGSAIASPTDHREMVPVNAPGDEGGENHKVNRAELISVITEQLGKHAEHIGKALKQLDYSGARGQVVLTGGGGQLAGIAEYMQGALGRPVRIGTPPDLRGLGDLVRNPAFASLVGLCLYAAEDPVDIRSVSSKYQEVIKPGGIGLISRIWHAAREYF